MKILYINPLRTDITLTLLDEGIVEEVITLERGDDFAKFPETVISILHEKNPEEIWFLLGPGPFTRMRIITLTLSTLIFSRSIRVKGCHFFDLIDIHHPILRANDQEYIISDSSSGTRLILVEDIPGGTYMGYGEKNDFTDGRDYIEYIEDWGKI